MAYFNYHAKAQNLIKSGHLVRFDEYLELINSLEMVDFCAPK